MGQEQRPEETPLTQEEWEQLSEASRLWVLEALAAVKEEEQKQQGRVSSRGARSEDA